MSDHPKYALMYKDINYKVRVLYYEGDGYWMVVDWNDMYRIVAGKSLTFLP